MSLALAVAEIIAAVICLTLVHGRDLRKMLSLFYVFTCIGAIIIMSFDFIYTGKS
jgi:hypothetical protein